MPNLAHVQLIGHIGKVSDIIYLPSGNAVLKFSMAVNTGYDKNKRTTWYNVTMFGKRAESVSKFLAKGNAVMTIGEISMSEWTSEKTGKNGVSLEVIASDIVLLGDSKRDEQHQEEQPQQEAQKQQKHSEPKQSDFGDEATIPF
jgi:single-strand DNA-binding protein